MSHVIGVEQLSIRMIVWVLDLPGCAVEVAEGDSVTAKALERVETYLEWREGYRPADKPQPGPDAQLTVSNFVHQAYDGKRRAFFEADRSPLTSDDAFELGWLLQLSRRELERALQLASSELLGDEPDDSWAERKRELEELLLLEQRQINALVMQPAAFDESDSILMRLADARAETLSLLPALVGREAVEREEEIFSARKLARLLIHHDLQAVHNLRMVAARG